MQHTDQEPICLYACQQGKELAASEPEWALESVLQSELDRSEVGFVTSGWPRYGRDMAEMSPT